MNLPGNITIKEFENVISNYCESEFSIAVCNATIGILGVFYALGLSHKEIITTPLTWPGALSGLFTLNCKLKFCDVEPNTLTIDPEKLESLITPTVAAVFTADFLGYPALLDQIKNICTKHNILLIHDGSSSFGSRYMGKHSGYFADVTILSFGSKKLFTTGEGGCIISNRNDIYERLVLFLTHPGLQNIYGNCINPFALNTRINPLAAEYGLKTFKYQIKKNCYWQMKVRKWLDKNGANNLSKELQPNYYKILVDNQIKKILSGKNNIKYRRIPFNQVIYKEPLFIKLFGNHRSKCTIAEDALLNYNTLNIEI
jgi:dTDP-4-amino-4,6-dideoxygalactose transaminase